MSTKIYVEGGGDHQKRTIQACRAAFSRYFQKVVPEGAQPRIVACGSRQKAYEDFRRGLSDPDYDMVLLLVDSEGLFPRKTTPGRICADAISGQSPLTPATIQHT